MSTLNKIPVSITEKGEAIRAPGFLRHPGGFRACPGNVQSGNGVQNVLSLASQPLRLQRAKRAGGEKLFFHYSR